MHLRMVGTLASVLLLGALSVIGSPAQARTPGDDYMSFRQLANDVAPMVVSIQARWTRINRANDGSLYETYTEGNTGSGFVYDDVGHVITSYANLSLPASDFLNPRDPRANEPDHIAEYIKVVFQDRAAYQAEVVGFDQDLDLAVLKLVGLHDRELIPLPLAPASEYALGQPLLTMAYNFLSRDRINVSFGVVSALRSQFPSLEDSANDFIQVAFPKNQGYDGGPMVDLQGNVVAMITSAAPYGETVEVHFGIPSNLLKERIDTIIEKGYVPRKWFGFNLIALNESIRLSYDIPEEIEGMFIVYVEPGSPAASAGLRNGDVLVEFNGTVIDSTDKLKNELEKLQIGDTTSLVYLRRDFNVFDRFSVDFNLLEKPRDPVQQSVRLPSSIPGGNKHY